MGEVKAVCISTEKGVRKEPLDSIRIIEDFGVEGDAHAGKWHRQFILLCCEAIEEFNKREQTAYLGKTLLYRGLILRASNQVFRIRDVLLELTRIGNERRSRCSIGDCIMPQEGVFTKVLNRGAVKARDKVEIVSSGISRRECGAF